MQMDKTKYFNIWRGKIFVHFTGHFKKKRQIKYLRTHKIFVYFNGHLRKNYSHTVAPKLIRIIVFPRNTTYIQQNLPPPPFFYCSTVWHWPDCSSGQIFFNQNSSEYITWSNFGSLAIKRHICIWNLNGRLKVKKTVCIMAWHDLRILK